jgi:Cu-processing system permease protein
MSGLSALVLNGFRESRRNRVTLVVFLFAFLMIFSATFAMELTVATFDRVMTDLGLGVMALITSFLAIFLATGLIPREIERRTIFMVVSKPISRSMFVVGRFLGNMLTLYAVLTMMVVLFFVQLQLGKSQVTQAHVAAVIGLALELLVISAVSFLFASASSQFVASVISVGLYFLGHLATDLYTMASRSQSAVLSMGGKALYYVLPNLDRLDLRPRATYGELTSWAELGGSAVYAVGYSVVLLVIACLLFEKRDFK